MELSDFPRLDGLDEYQRFVSEHPVAAVYFSGADCAVCSALAPKLCAALSERFPQLALGWVDCAASAVLAAHHQVFSVPVLVVYFDGRESLRKVRSFSISQLCSELERPYEMLCPS